MKTPEVLLKIHEFIKRPLQRAPEQRRFHSIAAAYSMIGGILLHLALIFIFFSLGVREMGILGIFSVLIYLFSLFLVYRDKVFLAAFIPSLEIVIHMIAAIYFIGFHAGFQLFFITVIYIVFTTAPGFRRPLYPFFLLYPGCGSVCGLYRFTGSLFTVCRNLL